MATLALLELLPEPQFAALARHLPAGAELRAVASTDDAEARRLAAEADILLVWNGPLPSATLAAARQARLAQVCERRPRGVDFFAARRRGLPVAGPGPAGARDAAEHALLLALAGLRCLPAARAEQTVGLYGLDPVARTLAVLVSALEARVIAWSGAAAADADWPPRVERAQHRYEALAAADVVSLHLPPTPDQRHVVSRETLRLLRRDAILVNVSSPELIDEVSLYQALANGRLGGAALDGLADAAAAQPLLGLPSTLITPRLAYATSAAIEELAAAAMANAARALAGQEPLHRWV
jgi:phosphoglycerate dehydrogenase-like enzyme